MVSCSLFRPHRALHLRCQRAQRSFRPSWNIFTQMSLPPLKVIFQGSPTYLEALCVLVLLQYYYCFTFCSTESLNVEFVCNVLVVADQLLITRLKEMCEVVITENCKFIFNLSFQPVLADIRVQIKWWLLGEKKTPHRHSCIEYFDHVLINPFWALSQ